MATKPLKPTAQRLYNKLKELCGNQKKVTITKGKLAEEINISSITDALKKLTEHKLVRVDKNPLYKEANTYIILK